MSGSSARREPGARHRGHLSHHDESWCDGPADHALGRSRGGSTTNDRSPLRRAWIATGGASSALATPTDSPMFDPLDGPAASAAVAGRGRPRTRPAAAPGDKADSSRAHRARSARPGYGRGRSPNSPPESITADAAAAEAGARSALDAPEMQAPQTPSNESFNIVKNRRGLATRYEKPALTYRAAAVLAAICAWLRHLRDTP